MKPLLVQKKEIKNLQRIFLLKASEFNINFSIFEELNDKLEQNIQEVAKERENFLSHDEILEHSIARAFRNQYIRKYVNQV
jgi:hypothetical protein